MDGGDRLKVLAASGATRRQAELAVGHALTEEERDAFERARLALKLAAQKRRAAKSAPMTTAERVARLVARRNDIGELPEPADPELRESCRRNLPKFLRAYLPDTFTRPFSKAALRFLKDCQDILTDGGGSKKAVALPRGFGKTSLCVGALVWAAVYAHRRYICLVAATEKAARQLVRDIAAHLQSDRVARDFPAVGIPLSRLGGTWQKAKYQTFRTAPTNISVTANEIVLATVGAETDGVTLSCHGLTGAIRGLHRTLPSGEVIRPDAVLLDDCQTAKSAKSPSQVDERERLVNSDVLGLAGHGVEIAAVMACTCICRDDLSERFLDAKRRPEWRGQRERLIDGFGGDDRWREYDSAWRREQAGELKAGSATRLYRRQRRQLEEGLTVLDRRLFGRGEVSAVQHARDKLLEMGDFAFEAEMQNAPVSLQPEAEYELRASHVLARTNGLGRGEIPENAVRVVAACDINRYALAWLVAASDSSGSLYVMDYGWWTPPGRHQLWEDTENRESKIAEAIDAVFAMLLGDARYGNELDAVAVDAGYSAQTVYDAVAAQRRKWPRRRLYASRGLPGDRYELPRNRRVVIARGDGADIRRNFPNDALLQFDSHWHHLKTQKSFLLAPGTEGETTLFGTPDRREMHRAAAEQICADRLVSTRLCGNGRTFAQFAASGHNEAGDCLAEASALASLALPRVPAHNAGDEGDERGRAHENPADRPSPAPAPVRIFRDAARSRRNWATDF